MKRKNEAYMRREYPKRTPKEKYNIIRDLNKELGFKSKNEYFERANEHSRFIEDPKSYFKDCWNCWYDFLGVDCSVFPQTKTDWICVCKIAKFCFWFII